jgi:hypothetical protein
MRRPRELETRLKEWADEYGGGRYESYIGLGNSPLASMMKWHGRPPSGLGHVPLNTAADEVEEAYEALCKQEQGWLPAQVLRCEYCLPGQPIESKIQKLARFGEQLSRVRYYQLLRVARIHVAGWLHLPFSEELEQVDLEA